MGWGKPLKKPGKFAKKAYKETVGRPAEKTEKALKPVTEPAKKTVKEVVDAMKKGEQLIMDPVEKINNTLIAEPVGAVLKPIDPNKCIANAQKKLLLDNMKCDGDPFLPSDSDSFCLEQARNNFDKAAKICK